MYARCSLVQYAVQGMSQFVVALFADPIESNANYLHFRRQ